GVDQERARQQKILKLSSKIAELQEAVKSSDELSKAFNNELLREIEFFHQAKLEDTKRDLKEYAINQVKYYEKCVEFWDQIVPVLENIKIDDE
ncbi:intercellular trafficking and secretion, partial [Rhizoclosmatium hyalinum]